MARTSRTLRRAPRARVRAPHTERHRTSRIGWLRAAVLGADDGVVSVASLMIGVAAANASRSAVLLAGLAGLVAGAGSMAAGEYVSVSSQRDAELADIARERREQIVAPDHELEELTQIYVERGLDPHLAHQVAVQMHEADPLGSHLRDELGITDETRARPVQAAAVSAVSFAVAATVPIVSLLVSPRSARVPVIAAAALVALGVLGAIGGRIGGAPRGRAAVRVVLGGGLAMAITALIGSIIGAAGL
ncbi:MAG: VIT family protein [Actinobacteria bacterium]|nr:VIT family protein [Actinomycetota bacterium]